MICDIAKHNEMNGSKFSCSKYQSALASLGSSYRFISRYDEEAVPIHFHGLIAGPDPHINYRCHVTAKKEHEKMKKTCIYIIFIYLFLYIYYIYIYSEKSSTYLIGPPSCTTGILISDIVSIICPVRVSMVTSSSSLCARWRVSCYIQYK